jgi:hypothetical protein
MSRAFRHRPALEGLPKGAERQIVEQFREVQNDLDSLRRPPAPAPPVFSGPNVMAQMGQLLRLEPGAGGILVTLPQGSPENITQRIHIALVGGILSPGVAVSIVGRKGTINGQQVLYLTSYRLVELVSCGDRGWFYST